MAKRRHRVSIGDTFEHFSKNEIVAAMHGASNRLIDVETLSEQDLTTLHRYYGELAKLAQKESDVTVSHSVEEARSQHSAKLRATPRRE